MTKVTKKGKNTQIRVTEVSADMIRRLSRDLFKRYETEHIEHGLKTPSSRLAVDYLIYEAALAGIGSWPKLDEEHNLWMMIHTAEKEE